MNAKTPWNPSAKAIARVRDPLPAPQICRYCNGDVRIIGHAEIYGGRTFGDWPWVFRCDQCHARVGMHPFTNIPLGTLANDELRKVREACKAPFNRLWQAGGVMGRTEAYRWLAQAMGKTVAQCRFGLFEIRDCERAMQLCIDRLETVRP